MTNIKLGVLVSGSGTNLQAIIDAVEQGVLNAELAVVISNKKDAYALERARKHQIPALFINHKDYAKREDFEQALIKELDSRNVDLVCLAGFMRVLTPYFVNHFPHRILNIHPALLPAAKGLYGEHVHQAILDSGAKFSGCTVHFVTADVDGGPIVLQKIVPVEDDDTPLSLAERILEVEHTAYPEAVKLFSEHKLEIIGNRVKIKK
ncbi:MAG: phosphoribosylglycinamide formyltransferase [Candidatus Latescibacteria bacterium]|nr:phosphoribosylglycinamide formyltransferase [Candidatus Latescibacterota bacterium]